MINFGALPEFGPETFRTRLPFPHVVIDNFLDEVDALQIAQDFPAGDDECWKPAGWGQLKFDATERAHKQSCSDAKHFPESINAFFNDVHSQRFLAWLLERTGSTHYITDPFLNGGGMHSTGRSGRLMVHADMSRHSSFNWRVCQTINIIYFANAHWESEWNGNLELWDRKAQRKRVEVEPRFNRAVIFDTSSTSFHGMPVPLECPQSVRRNTLAVYLYEIDRPVDEFYRGPRRRTKWVFTNDDERAARDVRAIQKYRVGRGLDRISPFVPSAVKKFAKRLRSLER